MKWFILNELYINKWTIMRWNLHLLHFSNLTHPNLCVYICMSWSADLPPSSQKPNAAVMIFIKALESGIAHFEPKRPYWLWNSLCLSCFSQHPKVRNVFNLDFPDSNHLAKTLTIVSGPDTVNLTYHNFFASKEKVTQVRNHWLCVLLCCWHSAFLTCVTLTPSYWPNTAIDH